jgi:ABC-type transport system substrate-binding protein
MTGHNNGARLRAGLAVAAVAAALLAAAWGGSPARAAPAPAPRSGATVSGYLYWSNATTSDPGNGTIGRARLNGTDLNQKFIKVPSASILLGVAVDPGRHD